MGALGDEAELKQANAAYSLLEDRYKNKVRRVTWPYCQILSVELVADNTLQYRILGQLMEPKSNPTYYADLITELEEAPTRTWYQRLGKRLGGMIRLQ